MIGMLGNLNINLNIFKLIKNSKIFSFINAKFALYTGLAAYWVVILSSTFFGI